jgi:hypothetical protein
MYSGSLVGSHCATSDSPFIGNNSRVPHISLVFREMWDTTDPDLKCDSESKAFGLSAVVSHISRKTSEIWGTRDPW